MKLLTETEFKNLIDNLRKYSDANDADLYVLYHDGLQNAIINGLKHIKKLSKWYLETEYATLSEHISDIYNVILSYDGKKLEIYFHTGNNELYDCVARYPIDKIKTIVCGLIDENKILAKTRNEMLKRISDIGKKCGKFGAKLNSISAKCDMLKVGSDKMTLNEFGKKISKLESDMEKLFNSGIKKYDFPILEL